jgi:hypothetical protein
MDPVTWANAKGPAYIGVEVGAAICVILLISFTVMRIINASYEPGIDASLVAAAAAILGTAGMKFDKSANGSNSA